MRKTSSSVEVFEEIAGKHPRLNWFVLADCAHHEDLPARLMAHSRNSRCLFGSPKDSPLSKHTPYLIQLDSPLKAAATWRLVSHAAAQAPCISIIAASLEFESLYLHLGHFLEVVLPDGDTMFFAFWDGAIFGSLIGQADDRSLHVPGPVLSAEQISMLLGAIEHWWYWGRTGTLHAVSTSASQSRGDTNFLKLSQQQVDELVEASVPDHVLYYINLNQPHLIRDVQMEERYPLVRAALRHAHEIGLITMRDLVDFVCVSLMYRPDMYQNEQILGLLERVRLKEISFRQAIGELP